MLLLIHYFILMSTWSPTSVLVAPYHQIRLQIFSFFDLILILCSVGFLPAPSGSIHADIPLISQPSHLTLLICTAGLTCRLESSKITLLCSRDPNPLTFLLSILLAESHYITSHTILNCLTFPLLPATALTLDTSLSRRR